MDTTNEALNSGNSRGRTKDRSGGPAYEQVANKAVYKEADYKVDVGGKGLSVSTTVVGETVTFTQNFNF